MERNNGNKSPFKIGAFILAGIAISLLVVSFFIPPVGAITPSALQGAGEIMGIIALFMGWEAMERGIDAKIKHKETEIEFTNDSDISQNKNVGE